MPLINYAYLINALVYSVLGLVLFALGFYVLDKLTPYNLWQEIVQNKNSALATVVGAAAIGISLIIASAIHG